MKRTGMLLLLLALGLPAPAAIYECRDSKGNLFLTDDPDNLPADCSREEVTVREEEAERTGREAPMPAPARRETAPVEADRAAAPARSSEPTAPLPRQSTPVVPPASPEDASRESVPAVPDREGSLPGTAGAPADEPPAAGAPAAGTPAGAEGTPGRAEPGESAAETGASPATPDRAAPPGAGAVSSETARGAQAQAAFEASLERWRTEAAALGRQYLEAQAATPGSTPAGGREGGELSAADRQGEAQGQIDQFLDRLDASPLTPEEKAAIWRELPPEAIR